MAALRRPKIPSHVLAGLRLSPKEKVLGVAQLADGWAVTTTGALVVVDDGHVTRAPWEAIASGALDGESSELRVEWVDARPALVLQLDPRTGTAFARSFRERMDSSVVHRATVEGGRAGTARIAIRRGEDGTLYSEAIIDGPADDPDFIEAVDEAEDGAREAVGLPPLDR